MGDVRGRAVVLVVQVGGEGGDADLDLTLVPVSYPAQPELPADLAVLLTGLPPALFTAPHRSQTPRALLQSDALASSGETARGPTDSGEEEQLLLRQL